VDYYALVDTSATKVLKYILSCLLLDFF